MKHNKTGIIENKENAASGAGANIGAAPAAALVAMDDENPQWLATQALQYHLVAKNSAGVAVMAAAYCGTILKRAKEMLPHGEFGKWAEQYLPLISAPTRSRYLALAEHLNAQIYHRDNFELSDIARISLPDPRDIHTTENNKLSLALQDIIDGRSLTDLYKDFGIIKGRVTKGNKAEQKVNEAIVNGMSKDEALAHVYALNLDAMLHDFDLHINHFCDEDYEKIKDSMTRILGKIS